MAPIRAAILGCGLFTNDVYARLLVEFQDRLELKAAWSRTEASATQFVSKHAPAAQALHGDVGMSLIMSDPQVDLVIVVLPPQAALQAVQDALNAGKHVIEEKPVAGTVADALKAVHTYRLASPPGLWMFAENYRYEAVFLEAARVISSGQLGDIVKMDLIADMPMSTANRYYSSSWRRDQGLCPGGQIMESSVHYIAAVRLMAQAAGLGEATQATAFSRHTRADLSPPDTLVGFVTFPQTKEEGAPPVPVSVSISLAAAQVRWSFSVVGSRGSLEVLRGGWGGSRSAYTLNMQVGSDPATSTQLGFTGTSREMGSFLHLMESWPALVTSHEPSSIPSAPTTAPSIVGTPEDPLFSGDVTSSLPELLARSSPEEGVRDLALVEALLRSSEQEGKPVEVVQVPGPRLYSAGPAK